MAFLRTSVYVFLKPSAQESSDKRGTSSSVISRAVEHHRQQMKTEHFIDRYAGMKSSEVVVRAKNSTHDVSAVPKVESEISQNSSLRTDAHTRLLSTTMDVRISQPIDASHYSDPVQKFLKMAKDKLEEHTSGDNNNNNNNGNNNNNNQNCQ